MRFGHLNREVCARQNSSISASVADAAGDDFADLSGFHRLAFRIDHRDLYAL